MKTAAEIDAIARAHNRYMMQPYDPKSRVAPPSDPEFDAAFETLTDAEIELVAARALELRN